MRYSDLGVLETIVMFPIKLILTKNNGDHSTNWIKLMRDYVISEKAEGKANNYNIDWPIEISQGFERI